MYEHERMYRRADGTVYHNNEAIQSIYRNKYANMTFFNTFYFKIKQVKQPNHNVKRELKRLFARHWLLDVGC